jgi:acetylornithine deacetylase/succinyl-diaminopimelate desuccinylase-like protein
LSLTRALERARTGRERAEAEFFEELRIPSVGTLVRHASDTRSNADWLLERFRRMGMTGRLFEHGGGMPTVIAEWMGRPGAPTLVLYGHYDVQPADPLELWDSPPFEPHVADGYVFARGASDNKGEHMACLKAAEHALEAGGPPVNLRFLIEGEEEGGGEVLTRLLQTEWESVGGEFSLICDGTLLQLLTGLRGNLYVEIEVFGARQDLHSGAFGGLAPNALNTLALILAGLKDREGRVFIPGFYDDVRDPTPEEKAAWSRLPLTQETVEAYIGAPLEGESGYSIHERNFSRPTLDIHGVIGGFTERVGGKTVIPASGLAKLSMRLVPDQDPDRIFPELERYAKSLATPGTRAEVRRVGAAWPILIDVVHPGIRAAADAFESAFGKRPDLVRAGYTIPVVAEFSRLPTHLIVTGFAREDDGAHAPNERMSLENFHRGVEMLLHLMWNLA